MFTEFTNQVYTASDSGKVTITDNTDFSIDGSSKKIVFGLLSQNEYVDISFDSITLSAFEEFSFHIYAMKKITSDDLFKITLNGTDYTYESLTRNDWNQVLIDCQAIGAITSFRITNLTNSLTLFFDYPGVRSVDYANMDIDVLKALQAHISLDYDVATTTTADAATDDREVVLDAVKYVYSSSKLNIDDGVNNQDIFLQDFDRQEKTGTINAKLLNDYASGSTITVLCPVELEDFSDIEPDPVCGIVITDIGTSKDDVIEKLKDGVKHKQFLGELGIMIYIDCTSKLKVLNLTRQYQKLYGKRFMFLLDGAKVEIYLEDSTFIDGSDLGVNPRTSFLYRIQPEAVTIATGVTIDDFTLEIDSGEID